MAARAKSKARARSVGRPRKAETRKREDLAKETILNMKGSSDYYDFVDAKHRETGISKAEMFRRAFKDWCERKGLGTPPPI